MQGEFLPVWREMWRNVWKPLSEHPTAPDDLFVELFREVETIYKDRLDAATTLAEIVDDTEQSKAAFRNTKADQLKGEIAFVRFLTSAFEIVQDFGGDALSNRYYRLIQKFIDRYNLRYDLRRSFQLNPTLPGMFARLVSDLKLAAAKDAGLKTLLHEYEEAFRDLGFGQTEGRIKTCFAKQFNLLEAVAAKHPQATQDTLGKICNELNVWPHATVREAAKKIYGFRSYPGIGHGAGDGALRPIEMRDLISLSVQMTALLPYISDQLNADEIYWAGVV
ncbi:hypothetical protein SAMN05216227_10392 [Pseudorhodobacter antarcticus]|uniref:Uncharacterized protein n=1 Tax=Pseudorhodobacter antarcticus TaxID=1077947 RepID=A0A1H8L7S0_9RHOB|nr:hypothetical protein [Pseudorhodobacter antarcticus]SEO00758.1 hypothetical protein SAMN05216227_10392 [Pseudorhodobacter antarcticus]